MPDESTIPRFPKQALDGQQFYEYEAGVSWVYLDGKWYEINGSRVVPAESEVHPETGDRQDATITEMADTFSIAFPENAIIGQVFYINEELYLYTGSNWQSLSPPAPTPRLSSAVRDRWNQAPYQWGWDNGWDNGSVTRVATGGLFGDQGAAPAPKPKQEKLEIVQHHKRKITLEE